MKTPYYKWILALIGVIYIFIESFEPNGDFGIFLTASNDLFKGVNIYEKNFGDSYHYLYSIFFAGLLKPLTFLPFQLARFVWLLINLFLLIRIFKIIYSYFDVSFLSEKKKYLFYLLCFLVGMRFIRDNFHLAQLTILILYCILEGTQLVFKGKAFPGALIIAFGINVKLLPIVLLPYLFWRKEFKAGALILLFCITFYLLPLLFIGVNQFSDLMISWWQQVNPTNAKHIIDVDERSFHSLSSLLPTLLMEKVPDIHALNVKRNILSLDFKHVELVLNLIRLGLILLTVHFVKIIPFRKEENKLSRIREIAYLSLVVPLIFPHQQHYAFLLSLPALCYMLYTLFVNYSLVKLILLIIVYLCFNLSVLLGEFNHWYEHFKIITYGSLILVFLLVFSKPNQLKTQYQ